MARAVDPAGQSLRHRKARERSLILMLVGLCLVMPPLANIFEVDAKVAGVPVALVYLFSVWALLIASAFALSRRLRTGGDGRADPADAEY